MRPFRDSSRRLLLALGLFTASPLAAQVSILQVPPDAMLLATQTWNTSNGLPQNTATAIVQARNGFVWIATYGGLCRYDGEHLVVFDTTNAPGLPTNRFTCMRETEDGTLWLGSDHAGLCRFRDGVFARVPEVEDSRVEALGQDAAGRLLVATPSDVLRLDREELLPLYQQPLPGITEFLLRRNGELLASSRQGLHRLGGLRAEPLLTTPIRGLAEFGDDLLVGNENGVSRVVGSSLQSWSHLPGLGTPVLTMMVASDGALWVGTVSRTVRLDPSQRNPVPGAHLMSVPPMQLAAVSTPQMARALGEDHEGGIWIGHTEDGVTRVRRAELRNHGERQGLPPRGIVAVVGGPAAGDPLYVATDSGLLRRSGHRFDLVPGAESLGPARGMCLDPDGTLWFGTSRGLARFDGQKAEIWRHWPDENGQRLRAIVRTPTGEHWLGGVDGIQLRTATGLVEPPIAAPLRGHTVRSLAQSADGALWIGCTDQLVRISTDFASSRTWRSGVDLPFGEIRTILPEAGEKAWIATYGGGLVQIENGACRVIDERHGLCDQSLCGLLVHGDQFVLASNRGICMAARSSFEAVAMGRTATVSCRLLRPPAGHPAEINGGLQPCVTQAAGKLWFCGIRDLLEFDPDQLEPLHRHLPTHLRGIYLGNQLLAPGRDFHLPSDVRSASFLLGTCAFEQTDQVRYRWRLVGLDEEWGEPLYRREIRYAALPAGDFTFEAQAVDLDGRPSASPLRVALHVPSYWWESLAFRIGAPLLLLAGAILLFRFGAARTALRAAHLQSLVESRTSELRQAQLHLEQRVAKRTEELQAALQHEQAETAERQRLERELQRMQRMESIGQLAGGIAHDFNNLLTIAGGAAELLALEVESDDGTDLCRSIQQACQRGRNLTQHLLGVASRQLVTVATLDLNRVVGDLLPVLRSLLGHDVALRFTAPPSSTPVRGAVTQIEQILLNLCANAHDALPRGGNVTIRIVHQGGSVQLEVEDDGEGIPPEVMARVFEPFFSTKGRGIGRGLGLATVYGITKQLGGDITLDSAVGRGTSVRLTLPMVAVGADQPDVDQPRTANTSLQGRILLVEDEADVRAVLARLLFSIGLTVVEADDGQAALKLLRGSPERFDAVVSDVVMPGLQGRELVLALRGVCPGLPIVFVSGFLDGRLTHQDLREMGLEILGKPVDRDQLAALLRRVLPGAPLSPSAAPPAPAHRVPTAP
jgi:signal transduction histidine kinase/ligand-binding sensor domain-containing protein/ActR/RegA family two-component response regulator